MGKINFTASYKEQGHDIVLKTKMKSCDVHGKVKIDVKAKDKKIVAAATSSLLPGGVLTIAKKKDKSMVIVAADMDTQSQAYKELLKVTKRAVKELKDELWG